MEIAFVFAVIFAAVFYVYHRLNSTFLGRTTNQRIEEAHKSFYRGDGYPID